MATYDVKKVNFAVGTNHFVLIVNRKGKAIR